MAGYTAGAAASVSAAAAWFALPRQPDFQVTFYNTSFVLAVLASGISQCLGAYTFLWKIAWSSEDRRSNAVKLAATNIPAAVSLIWGVGNATEPLSAARTTILSLSQILIVTIQANFLAALAALVSAAEAGGTQAGPQAGGA